MCDLIDAQRMCPARLMANAERDHSEPNRRSGWRTATITAPKRPAGHGTYVLTQPPSQRAVAAFRFADQEPLTG